MGECSDCWKSDEQLAIERIAKRRANERTQNVPSTDYLDRLEYEKCLKEVKDEFVLLNGRLPH